ncbi:MAG: hypothetical protein IKH26_05855 [Bacteroidaceae bacterium]|nr:hypothetical protein [Bacteroidaceae bacterium]
MKKRLAKKAFSRSYYVESVKPGTEETILVPRNARCADIIKRATTYCRRRHSEWMEKVG